MISLTDDTEGRKGGGKNSLMRSGAPRLAQRKVTADELTLSVPATTISIVSLQG